jgi:hypothetical protein
VQRILTGKKTIAELSRDPDIAPSVIRNRAQLSEAGAMAGAELWDVKTVLAQLGAWFDDYQRGSGMVSRDVELLRAGGNLECRLQHLRYRDIDPVPSYNRCRKHCPASGLCLERLL